MRLLALALLLVATAAAYAPVVDHDFIIVDDPRYYFMNPWVLDGLTLPGMVWAATTFEAFNWHPLTWVSLMADAQLFGPEPWGPHLVNVGFHLLNTALLFFALARLTGREWESLLVAALFALHPMHVESVAWIAERKDVLSTCFAFLTLWAYGAYASRPGIPRYLLVTVCFAAGLMAKPMVVTLPFVLLLLDRWPLERRSGQGRGRWGWLVLEKMPLLLLSLGASVLTLAAQRPGVAHTAETLPWMVRIGSSLVAYARYIQLTLWPAGLSAFYPHPQWVPLWEVALATAVLLGVTVLVLSERHRRPYLLVGWLWFIGTLVPVIGLVQVGDQAMADRYTYLPHIGLFVMMVWAGADLLRQHPAGRIPVLVGSLALLVVLAEVTRERVALWESTETLFEDALEVTGASAFAHYNLAIVLRFEDRDDEARAHLVAAVEADPHHAQALNALGNVALRDGDLDGALDLYLRAVESGAWLFEAQFNAASVLELKGETARALPYYLEAERLEPYHVGVQFRLAEVFEARHAYRKAAVRYRRALQIDPDLDEARAGLLRVQSHVARRRREKHANSP